MVGFQIADWQLKIDVMKTREIYETMAHKNEPVQWLNYLEVSSFAEQEVLSFLDALGVDILKPSQLNYSLVEEGTMVMYTGVYYVHGEVIQGELEGWDVLIGQHCFSLTENFESIPPQMQEPLIEISFEAVLPWILEISMQGE